MQDDGPGERFAAPEVEGVQGAGAVGEGLERGGEGGVADGEGCGVQDGRPGLGPGDGDRLAESVSEYANALSVVPTSKLRCSRGGRGRGGQ